MLEASRRCHTKGQQQLPPRVGTGLTKGLHRAFVHMQLCFSVFAGTWSYFRAARRRLNRVAGGHRSKASSRRSSEASVVASPEARSRRQSEAWRVRHQIGALKRQLRDVIV
jgi:hypothetical protein